MECDGDLHDDSMRLVFAGSYTPRTTDVKFPFTVFDPLPGFPRTARLRM